MKTKKLISIVLAALLLFSALPLNAFAAESTYTPSYDLETPVVLIHGIGQNDTFILDENGDRLKDSSGDYVTGWPLEVDIKTAIFDILPALLGSIALRRDIGLKEAMKKGAYDLLYAIHKDSEGNYENDVEVPCFMGSMAEMTPAMKSFCYSRIPVQKCGKIIGEDKVFYFGYDSIGDIETNTKNLHDYIHNVVLPKTGAKKVNLCPISLGGTLAVSYLGTYKEDYSLIKKIVYVVPAIDGSDIVGDLLTGNLSIEDDEALYFDLVKTLMGDTYGAYLVNILLRFLPKDVLKAALYALADGVVEALARNTTQLWALCPLGYYEEARAKWLSDSEHQLIAQKVDTFMKAREDFNKNMKELVASGAQVYDIVCYDLPIFPLCKNYKLENSDGIINCDSTSMGATFADLGTTLGEGYKAVGTYCSNPSHNHLSPDGMVDPTTGLLPCTTWYFKGQSHEALQYNDVCLSLATELMIDDNMTDVYSNPETYPQYNGQRNTRNADNMISEYKKADKDAIGKEKCDAIENAIAKVNAEKQTTVIDEAKWESVVAELENAMIAAGLREKSEPSAFETAFTSLTRKMNIGLNKMF